MNVGKRIFIRFHVEQNSIILWDTKLSTLITLILLSVTPKLPLEGELFHLVFCCFYQKHFPYNNKHWCELFSAFLTFYTNSLYVTIIDFPISYFVSNESCVNTEVDSYKLTWLMSFQLAN